MLFSLLLFGQNKVKHFLKSDRQRDSVRCFLFNYVTVSHEFSPKFLISLFSLFSPSSSPDHRKSMPWASVAGAIILPPRRTIPVVTPSSQPSVTAPRSCYKVRVQFFKKKILIAIYIWFLSLYIVLVYWIIDLHLIIVSQGENWGFWILDFRVSFLQIGDLKLVFFKLEVRAKK